MDSTCLSRFWEREDKNVSQKLLKQKKRHKKRPQCKYKGQKLRLRAIEQKSLKAIREICWQLRPKMILWHALPVLCSKYFCSSNGDDKTHFSPFMFPESYTNIEIITFSRSFFFVHFRNWEHFLLFKHKRKLQQKNTQKMLKGTNGQMVSF